MHFKIKDGISNLDFCPTLSIDKWDEQILSCGYPSPFQSTAYGEYLKHGGDTVRYLDIIYRNQKIGHCMFSIDQRQVAQCLYGPIVKENAPIEYEKVLMGLLQYLRSLKVVWLPLLTTQLFFSGHMDKRDCKLYSEIFDSPIVDLRQNFQDIYSAFDHSVRKNIKKCEAAGVEVVITKDNGFVNDYLTMLSSHRKRLGFGMPPFYPNEISMNYFNRKFNSMDVALARVGSEYLAGMGYVSFGGMLIEIGVAQGDSYQKAKLPAHDFIKAKAIQHYAKKGIAYYDLTGTKRSPKTEKEKNIKRFKMKFSQKTVEFATVQDVFFERSSYFRHRITSKVRNVLKGMQA